MTTPPIRVRLAVANALMVIATLTAAAVGTWLSIRDSIHDTVDAELGLRWDAMRGRVVTAINDARMASVSEELALTPDLAFRLSEGGTILYASAGAKDWGPSPSGSTQSPNTRAGRTISVAGEPIRVVTQHMTVNGVDRTAELGTPVEEFYEILDQFIYSSLLATPVLLLIAAGGGYWMSRRALAPVDRITRTARAIGAHNLTERLPLRGVDDELERLSTTLNGMFGRLDDAFRRSTQFTADASHELRTPVAIIQTAAEISRRRSRSELEYEQTLDLILAESTRMSQLIDDLLMLARADASEPQTGVESIDLARLLQNTCLDAQLLAESAGISLRVSVATTCVTSGDAQRLRRLFLILIDNAVKYSRAGGAVTVTLTTNSEMAVIEVRDVGIGIPRESIPRIFERFYRVAPDRSRSSGGAGLGLPIAQWIAKSHGGDIVVESVVGEGSIFRLTLPLRNTFMDSSEIRVQDAQEGSASR